MCLKVRADILKCRVLSTTQRYSVFCHRGGKKQETGLVILNWIQSVVDNYSVKCCSFKSHSNKTAALTVSHLVAELLQCQCWTLTVRDSANRKSGNLKNTPTSIKKRPQISFTRFFTDGKINCGGKSHCRTLMRSYGPEPCPLPFKVQFNQKHS